jgi:hypothetical protein
VDYILFFEKTTHFDEELYLGFKHGVTPHFSEGVHPEICSQPFTNTLYSVLKSQEMLTDKNWTNEAILQLNFLPRQFRILVGEPKNLQTDKFVGASLRYINLKV